MTAMVARTIALSLRTRPVATNAPVPDLATEAGTTVGPPPSTRPSQREPTKPSRWRVSAGPPSLSAASTSVARTEQSTSSGPVFRQPSSS